VKTRDPLIAAIGGYERAFQRDDRDVVQSRFLDVLLCLVRNLSADVNQAEPNGSTPLISAASSDCALVQCLAMELGADVNQAMLDGTTAWRRSWRSRCYTYTYTFTHRAPLMATA
jgi:rRNA maturation endonuclease Nob1